MRQIRMLLVGGGLLLAGPGWGQAPGPLPFFACGNVRFFGEGCVSPPPPPSAPAVPGAPTTGDEAPPAGASSPAAAPLFTPDTVAPTTPPLMLQLLQEPTEANARVYLAWHQARLARIREVQELVQMLTSPLGHPRSSGP